jgi:hypothetical protein
MVGSSALTLALCAGCTHTWNEALPILPVILTGIFPNRADSIRTAVFAFRPTERVTNALHMAGMAPMLTKAVYICVREGSIRNLLVFAVLCATFVVMRFHASQEGEVLRLQQCVDALPAASVVPLEDGSLPTKAEVDALAKELQLEVQRIHGMRRFKLVHRALAVLTDNPDGLACVLSIASEFALLWWLLCVNFVNLSMHKGEGTFGAPGAHTHFRKDIAAAADPKHWKMPWKGRRSPLLSRIGPDKILH